MVKVKRDLSGQVFGALTVIHQDDEDYVIPSTGQHYAKWICKCRCGNTASFLGTQLTGGHATSCGCGCYKNEQRRNTNRYELNLYDEHGCYGIGYTTNTNMPFYFDMDDYDKIKDYCWFSHSPKANYCRLETNIHKDDGGDRGGKHMKFHQAILGNMYDHIDRNPFNNRKYNLRPCTITQNNRNGNLRRNNSSGVSGVSFNKRKQKWTAAVTCDGPHFLGYHDNKDDAIRARLVGEAKYFGEFAPQMYLCEQYGLNPTLLNSPGNDIIKSRRRGNLK